METGWPPVLSLAATLTPAYPMPDRLGHAASVGQVAAGDFLAATFALATLVFALSLLMRRKRAFFLTLRLNCCPMGPVY